MKLLWTVRDCHTNCPWLPHELSVTATRTVRHCHANCPWLPRELSVTATQIVHCPSLPHELSVTAARTVRDCHTNCPSLPHKLSVTATQIVHCPSLPHKLSVTATQTVRHCHTNCPSLPHKLSVTATRTVRDCYMYTAACTVFWTHCVVSCLIVHRCMSKEILFPALHLMFSIRNCFYFHNLWTYIFFCWSNLGWFPECCYSG